MAYSRPLYQLLSSRLMAYRRCCQSVESGQNWQHWRDMAVAHETRIKELCAEHLPNGSGFDSGSKFNMEESRPDRLIISADVHHMDDNGYYDGWSEHSVIVKPSLAFDFTLTVTGRNRRQIKEYIHDVFHSALSTVCED